MEAWSHTWCNWGCGDVCPAGGGVGAHLHAASAAKVEIESGCCHLLINFVDGSSTQLPSYASLRDSTAVVHAGYMYGT